MSITPRYCWYFACERCGRRSGGYLEQWRAEQDAQGHLDHRCPGPWLLEPDDTRTYVSLLPVRLKPKWMRDR